MTFLLACIVAAVSITHAAITCPPGELMYNNRCYIFGNSNNYKGAAKGCSVFGYAVATVNDAATNSYLANVSTTDSLFYIGLTRSSPSSPWMWADGSAVNYTNFGRGDIGSNNCVVMFKPDGKWYTVACDANYGYACSSGPNGTSVVTTTTAPKVSTVSLPATCPNLYAGPTCSDGLFQYGNGCHTTFETTTPSAFSWCTSSCQSYGAQPASVHSALENFMMQCEYNEWGPGDCYPNCSGEWIGLRGASKAKMAWVDGTPLDYTNWAKNASSTCSSGDCCAYLTLAANAETGSWQITDCAANSFYLCHCRHAYSGVAGEKRFRTFSIKASHTAFAKN